MAANEIAERFAAACWVQCGSSGGEAANVFDVAQLRFRSQIGFKNILITTTDVNTSPMIVLQLDRVFSRRETALIVNRLGTVEPVEGDRLSYPLLGGVPDGVSQVAAHPCLMAWFGTDLTAPDWMPWGLGGSPDVPDGQSVDLFDAIAILLPLEEDDGLPSAGDFCVALFEHQRPEAEDEPIVDELPAELPPDPIGDLSPTAWFRADTFEEGDEVNELVGRVGTEGRLQGPFPVPAADATFNNQLTLTWDGAPNGLTSTMPPAFWDFLASDAMTVFIVACPRDTSAQSLIANDADEFFVLGDPGVPDTCIFSFGVAGASQQLESALFSGAIDIAQLFQIHCPDLSANDVAIQVIPTGFENTGTWLTPPTGTVTETLRALIDPANGVVSVAEWLFFDRALTAEENDVVLAYMTDRYGGF